MYQVVIPSFNMMLTAVSKIHVALSQNHPKMVFKILGYSMMMRKVPYDAILCNTLSNSKFKVN